MGGKPAERAERQGKLHFPPTDVASKLEQLQ